MAFYIKRFLQTNLYLSLANKRVNNGEKAKYSPVSIDDPPFVMHHLQAVLHHSFCMRQFSLLISSQSAEAENAWGVQGHRV